MSKNTTIQHKRSSVPGNTPDSDQIDVGELAINFPDQTLYTKDANGQIIEVSPDLWTDNGDGNISYEGGAVEVEELDIESGRLTAYADPIPEYVLTHEPGMGILWRNPVTGTILGIPGYGGSTSVRSTDNGATWQYLENPIDGSPYIEQINNFELGPVLFATNTDGSMTLFGTGWDNFYSTDDGLSWIPWTSMPKGKLEGPIKILYDEGTDRWRVLGAVMGIGALKTEFQGSDPNVYIGDAATFNSNWSPQSRAMIFDDGKVLFQTMSSGIQGDNRFVANMVLLDNSSSFLDDNIASRYDLDLTDTNYSSGFGRPSFEMGKDTFGSSMVVCAYTRADNTLGIRTTSDGETWTDVSDQLADLPPVDRSGYTTAIWIEDRQEWYVFVTKVGSSSSSEPGSAYVFKSSITGDLTSLVDVTRNALVPPRVQQAVGTDIGVWFVTNHYTGDTIEVKDITETNPPDQDLYWNAEKLATGTYVDNLVTNVYVDLSNTVKIETGDKQSIGGSSVQLNTEKVEIGYINDYGRLADQTNQIYLSERHTTSMSTPDSGDPNQLPTSISAITTEESTFNGRTTLPFTTNNYKPHRFRDKVEIDLDPTEDFDAVNKKYVDSAVNNLLQEQGATLDPDNATSSEFTGGSGTEIDPFEISPVSANFGDAEVHVATVNITGLDSGQVVYVEDLQAETNGDRFTAGARVADESGVLTVNIAFNDNPPSASSSVYQGKLRIGDTIYIDANVGVYTALEGGTVLASPTNTQPAGPVEWKGSGGRMLTATYPLVISTDGYYFTDKIETTDNNTEIWTKWAGDPGSGEGIDGDHGTTITGAVTDDVGGAQFFQLTILKETSFVFRNFVDSDQTVGGVSESRVVTAHTVNSYVYPSGTTTGSSPEYAKNGGPFTAMPATNTGSATDYLIDGDEFQLRHQDAATNNTASTFVLDAAGDSATWTTVTADVDPVILQPEITAPATDGEIDISTTGPFVSSDFEMASGTDTHTASSWVIGKFIWAEQPSLASAVTKNMFSVAWDGNQFCAVGVSGQCATSPDGVTWTKQTGLASAVGNNKHMYSVAWSGTQFCAVGYSGKCATSPDGVTWTNRPNFTSAVGGSLMNSVTSDGTQFVAVGGDGKCVTSPDGVTWTLQPSFTPAVGPETMPMRSVVWSGTQFISVGDWGQCATSPDGVTWTKQQSLYSKVGNTSMKSVAWDGTQFCAVGSSGKCATSPDGVTWTKQTGLASAVGNVEMYEVAWSGTEFCAVGVNASCATSPDGVTWTEQPSFTTAVDNATATMRGITWSGTQFCSVGNSGKCVTGSQTVVESLDSDNSALTSWEPNGLEGDTEYTVRVRHHTATLNSEWSEERSFRTGIQPGVQWTEQPSLASAVGDNTVQSVVWDGNQFLAVGNYGSCATSPDGVTWTGQPSLKPAVGSESILSVIWTGTQYCAVGYDGKCATSPDGITWTGQPSFTSAVGASTTMYAVAWSGSLFCAVGKDGVCATSPDGVTWTAQPSLASALNAKNMYSVTWTDTQFCAVGYNGACATSPDGVTWTNQPSLNSAVGNTNMYAVVWDSSQFCAVGANGGCATSPDGVTWTNQPSLNSAVSDNMRSVTWTGTQFCAVGEKGAFATSPDAVTWTNQPSFASEVEGLRMNSVAWDGTQFCAVGWYPGKCVTSP